MSERLKALSLDNFAHRLLGPRPSNYATSGETGGQDHTGRPDAVYLHGIPRQGVGNWDRMRQSSPMANGSVFHMRWPSESPGDTKWPTKFKREDASYIAMFALPHHAQGKVSLRQCIGGLRPELIIFDSHPKLDTAHPSCQTPKRMTSGVGLCARGDAGLGHVLYPKDNRPVKPKAGHTSGRYAIVHL